MAKTKSIKEGISSIRKDESFQKGGFNGESEKSTIISDSGESGNINKRSTTEVLSPGSVDVQSNGGINSNSSSKSQRLSGPAKGQSVRRSVKDIDRTRSNRTRSTNRKDVESSTKMVHTKPFSGANNNRKRLEHDNVDASSSASSTFVESHSERDNYSSDIFQLNRKILKLEQNLLVTNSGQKILSGEIELSIDPSVKAIAAIEGLNPITARDAASNSILQVIRSAKVRVPNTPLPGQFVLDSSYFERIRMLATGIAMSSPGVRHYAFSLNIGGFISHSKDEYVADNYSDDYKKRYEKIYNRELVEDPLVWPSEAQTLKHGANTLMHLYVNKAPSYILTNKPKSFDNGLVEVKYDTKSPVELQFVHTSTKYNYPTDKVLVNYTGDEGTYEYKKSFNNVRKHIASLSAGALNSAFNNIVREPYILRSILEQPIMLATFIKIMLVSIKKASQNQVFVLKKLGLLDPVASYIIGLKRAERTNLTQSIEMLNNFLKNVPINQQVFDNFLAYSDIKKLLDKPLDHVDNTLLIPNFTIGFPVTADTFVSSKEVKGDDVAFKTFDDIRKYNDKSELPRRIVSSTDYALWFRKGSILYEFLSLIKLYASNTSEDSVATISCGRFTDFMSAFITSMIKVRPSVLEQYITENLEFFQTLKEIDAFSDTIFSYVDGEVIDLYLRDDAESEPQPVKLGDDIIAEMPNNLLVYSSVLSDQILFDFDTSGYDTGRYFDNTVNFILSADENKPKDVIIYLKHAAISSLNILRNDMSINVGGHFENIDTFDKYIKDNDGDNRIIAFAPYHDYAVNPLLMQFTQDFLHTGWKSFAIDESKSSSFKDILVNRSVLRSGKISESDSPLIKVASQSFNTPKIRRELIDDYLKFSSSLGLYSPLGINLYDMNLDPKGQGKYVFYNFKVRVEPFIVFDDVSVPYHLI